ncbi:MAG: hydroxyacid dehydrogenase [Candidatus Heimdallarchaeota archaeon]|nr:hydroxyacid dehydrogenase [Candidatus Heimdallarchaeota archaeon]
MPTVLICDQISESATGILENNGLTVVDLSHDKIQLMERLSEADAVIVRSATKVSIEFLEKASNLKIVARAGVGLDNVDLAECKKRDIQVVNSPEGPSKSVAELVLMMMLALSRKLMEVDQGTKAGNWPKKTIGRELFGKTLGIIGSGAIGGTLAKYCIQLGMTVIAYDIIEYEELKTLEGFSFVPLDEVLSESDFISIHVPLLNATRHMINQETINKMKNNCIVINAARGGIIDEDALFRGLESGKLGGAALDVFEEEPATSANKLFGLKNVIATAHIGAQTYEASENNTKIVCEKLIEFFTSQ